MSADFVVRGVESAPAGDEFAALYGADLGMSGVRSVGSVGASRSAGNAVHLDGPDDDVVEIVDADGIVTFERAATLIERAQRSNALRGTDDQDITPFLDGAMRGSAAHLHTVRRYSVTLPDEIATAVATVSDAVSRDIAQFGELGGDGFGMIASRIPQRVFDTPAKAAMRKIVDWVDAPVPDEAPKEQRRKKPKVRGVYRVHRELELEATDRLGGPDAIADLAVSKGSGSGAYLMLLHGTFSHCEAAFARFRKTIQWEWMTQCYGERILAVEHATLGLTPAENALEAARLLPDGARLHLVSHSRGGLLGEALSYCAVTDPYLRTFTDRSHPDIMALSLLREELRNRNVRVERFVRVACPARGTTLASRRLDRWASFLFNVFQLVPVMRETGVAALVKKFLLTLLDQRTDPRTVPGLEAQMPESPFVRMLAQAEPLKDNGLASIVGDVQGSGIGRRLLVAGADLFYRADHDFVVPTESMEGGIRRPDARSARFQGPDVNHSAYFDNTDSREAVVRWLRGQPGAPVAGFPEPAATRSAGLDRVSGPKSDNVVIVVPDLFGTRLFAGAGDDRREVWPDVAGQIRLGAGCALVPGPKPDIGGLVDAYTPLLEALQRRYQTVDGCAYDPRHCLGIAADKLRASLRFDVPVHLVTHGAGALVALAALHHDGVLERWRTAGGRAVLLSPPLDGTYLVAAHRAGASELSALLALLDLTRDRIGIGELLGAWPSLDLLDPEDHDARTWRHEMLPASWARFTAIHGRAAATMDRRRADDREPTGPDRGAPRPEDGFVLAPGGDGHVAHADRPGLTSYYRSAPNAELPSDADVMAAVLSLLSERTPRLATSAPAPTADRVRLSDLRGSLVLPTGDDLVQAAFGGAGPVETRPVLRVRVVHGDICDVTHPIIVGHQNATPIGGSEKAIDDRLGGMFRRRLGLGAYPGTLGASEVFDSTASSPIVVIGLGDAGDLTAPALAAAVTTGVLRLAGTDLDRTDSADGSPLQLTLATVLIGTSLIPPLPVDNAVTAIATGVRHANRRLRDLGEPLVVDTLELVELYEERAIQAMHAAQRLTQTAAAGVDDEFLVDGRIVDGSGGRPGSPRSDYQEGVWRTIRIVSADQDGHPGPDTRLVDLTFTSIGRSAGAEQVVNTGQRELIDALVAEAIDNPHTDDQLFNTLYEMLVPNSLKGQGYGGENLMVVVDDQASVLPLEMLATRLQGEEVRPLAVDAGVIRRLETKAYRPLTRQASGKTALVVGDPPGTGLPRLEAARQETRQVAAVLRGRGYDVTEIIPNGNEDQPAVVPILNALFRHSYRIVHVAGHGNHSATDPTRSGVVIGPDTFLTALEIAKMRTAPDLVFLNCCHLAAMVPRTASAPTAGDAPPRPVRVDRLASSISRQLIENGVRAVVAAAWAVDDRAAAEFARTLYDGLLCGDDLGTAAHAARTQVFNNYRTLNTWGAYQVYGPPALRLHAGPGAPTQDRRTVGRREFRNALDDLKRRAEDSDDLGAADIRQELETLLISVPQKWHERELARIGSGWSALAEYGRAVAAFERLKSDWGATASLQNLETMANIKAKWATQLTSDNHTAEDPHPGTLLDDAEELLALLLQLGETPERLALRGGIARRRARCAPTTDEEADALVEARNAYQAAESLREKTSGEPDVYAGCNVVVLDRLISLRKGEPFDTRAAGEKLRRLDQAATANQSRSFWARVGPADVACVTKLVGGTSKLNAADIAERYEDAFTLSSRRERLTVIEHFDLVLHALRCDPAREEHQLLDRIRQRLANWLPPAR